LMIETRQLRRLAGFLGWVRRDTRARIVSAVAVRKAAHACLPGVTQDVTRKEECFGFLHKSGKCHESAQVVHTVVEVDGILIGFRFPAAASSVNVPGWHFHFLSADKTRGG